MILAIDPGTTESGWVRFDGARVVAASIDRNEHVLELVRDLGLAAGAREGVFAGCRLAIEKIEAMGMAVGAEVFETVHWAGRFLQAWHEPEKVVRVTRRAVKLHLCGNMRAKDPNIRQALIDALGPQGTKKSPGPTYGVKSHAWAALAVAVTALHQLGQRVETQPAPLFRESIDPFAEVGLDGKLPAFDGHGNRIRIDPPGEPMTATEVKQRREEWISRQTLPESPLVDALIAKIRPFTEGEA